MACLVGRMDGSVDGSAARIKRTYRASKARKVCTVHFGHHFLESSRVNPARDSDSAGVLGVELWYCVDSTECFVINVTDAEQVIN